VNQLLASGALATSRYLNGMYANLRVHCPALRVRRALERMNSCERSAVSNLTPLSFQFRVAVIFQHRIGQRNNVQRETAASRSGLPMHRKPVSRSLQVFTKRYRGTCSARFPVRWLAITRSHRPRRIFDFSRPNHTRSHLPAHFRHSPAILDLQAWAPFSEHFIQQYRLPRWLVGGKVCRVDGMRHAPGGKGTFIHGQRSSGALSTIFGNGRRLDMAKWRPLLRRGECW